MTLLHDLPSHRINTIGWDNLHLFIVALDDHFYIGVENSEGMITPISDSFILPLDQGPINGEGYHHAAFYRKAGVYYLSVDGNIIWSGSIAIPENQIIGKLAFISQYFYNSSALYDLSLFDFRASHKNSVYDSNPFTPPSSPFTSTANSRHKEVLFTTSSGSLNFSTNTAGILVGSNYVDYISPYLWGAFPELPTLDTTSSGNYTTVTNGSIFGSTDATSIAGDSFGLNFCLEAICHRTHARELDSAFSPCYVGFGAGVILKLYGEVGQGMIDIITVDLYYGIYYYYTWDKTDPAFPENEDFHIAVYRYNGITYLSVNGTIVYTDPVIRWGQVTRGFYVFSKSDNPFDWHFSDVRGVAGVSPYQDTDFTPPTHPLSRLIPENSSGFGGGFEVQSGPEVDDYLPLDPAFVVKREVVGVKEGDETFSIELYEGQFDKINIYIEGYYWPEDSWSLSGNQITLQYPVSIKQGPLSASYTRTEVYVVIEYVVYTRTPFYYWLTNTYSGALIGTSGLPITHLTLRKELHRQLLPTGVVDELTDIVVNSETTPGPIARYLKNVRDPLEKAVLATTVASIYLNS